MIAIVTTKAASVRATVCALAPLVMGAAMVHAQGDASAATQPGWCAKLARARNASLEHVRVPSTWFEVYRVDRDVYAIAEPRQWQEVISYLVIGGERALLFDSGLGIGDIRAVTSALTDKPIVVVNSHSHFDHVGGNHAFDRVLSLDLPYTRDHARGLPHGENAGEVAAASHCGAWPAGFDTTTWRSLPWRIAETVHDGSRIELGGRALELLHIPGHAPDAVALLDRTNGLLFTGDSFYEGEIWVWWPGADFDAYARSIERLAALTPPPTKLLTAHNVAVSSAAFLPRLRDAVRAIAAGQAKGTPNGKLVVYEFDGFSIKMSGKR